jgi:hypothetical protein
MLASVLPRHCRCRVMLTTVLLSHAGDGATDACDWPWSDVDAKSCCRRCCRVMLAMVLLRQCRCRVMLVTMLSSQLGCDVI